MSRFLDAKLTKLRPYTPGEQPQGLEHLIKLNTNESPFPPAPGVVAAIHDQGQSLRLYPDPSCSALHAAIAKCFDLSPEQVCAGNGSDEILAFLFHGFCPHGAVFPDITYGFYPVFADMFDVPYTEIPLREDFSVQLDDYAGHRETVFLANPNAPTGRYLPLAEIRALLEQDRDRLVVLDEAYVDFGGESAACLLGDYENLVVVHTFSKSRQLAGGRLGFALGSREIIRELHTLKFSFNPYSVSRLSLLAGVAAMEDVTYFSACQKKIIETREHTVAALEALGCTVLPSLANFLFVSLPGMSGGDCYTALRQRDILVRWFDKPRTRDYVRVTIGTSAQMDRFLTAVRAILKGA